jgi:two-component system nitrogen regulation sensor histidine kinase GlnL
MAKTKAPKNLMTGEPSGVPSALRMMNSLPDPVIGFDAKLRVCFSNYSAQSFFKLSEKQLLEKSMKELLGEGNAVFEAVETAARKNQTITLHDVSIAKKPVSSVILTAVEPYVWYGMVIRQQPLQLASEWNEKTKYSLKSTQMVAQMLAHEIKNPLAGIRGAAQLLGKATLNGPDRELTNLIERETLRIQELIDRFNVYDEVPQSQYKKVNLHEVLNHVAKIAQAEFGPDVEIKEFFDPSLPDIRGHFDHLVQAQLNLVKNAAEAFANKKGSIFIRTYYDNAAGFHPERAEKLPLCIEIEDNGRGITPDAINRIFQPYFTTKTNGKGLGLPIVSKIVDDHGGTIDVKSKPGRTVFKINLPLPLNMTRAKP